MIPAGADGWGRAGFMHMSQVITERPRRERHSCLRFLLLLCKKPPPNPKMCNICRTLQTNKEKSGQPVKREDKISNVGEGFQEGQ